MQVHMQVAPHVARAEPVDADDVRAAERDFLQLLRHFLRCTYVGDAMDSRPGNLETRMDDEGGNDNRADGVRKPEGREKNPEQDSDQHRDGAVRVAAVMPRVRLDRLAPDGTALRARVAEKSLLHDDGDRRHDGRDPLGMRLLAVDERHYSVVAEPDTHRAHRKTDAHRNERLETPMPVRMVRIGRGIPELGTDDYRDVGNEIRSAVDGIGNKRLGAAKIAREELAHRQDNVPAQAHQRNAADLGTVVFLSDAGHASNITNGGWGWHEENIVFYVFAEFVVRANLVQNFISSYKTDGTGPLFMAMYVSPVIVLPYFFR